MVQQQFPMTRVDADSLYESASKFTAAGQAIAVLVGEITKEWDEIKIGWVSPSQAVAEDFMTEVNSALHRFFGQWDGDTLVNEGVVDRFASAMKSAAINWGVVEKQLYYNFTWMASQIENPGAALDVASLPESIDPPAPAEAPTDTDSNDDGKSDYGFRNLDLGPITSNTPAMPQ